MNRRNFITKTGYSIGAVSVLSAIGCRFSSAASLGNWEAVRADFKLNTDKIQMAQFLLASHPSKVRKAFETHRNGLDENPVQYFQSLNRPNTPYFYLNICNCIQAPEAEEITMKIRVTSQLPDVLFYYTASNYLPVGTLGGLTPSVTLITSALVILVVYRDCKWHSAVGVLLCVTGVLLVIQPSFIFTESGAPQEYNPVYKAAATAALDISNKQNRTSQAFNVNISDHDSIDHGIALGVSHQVIGYIMGTAGGISSAVFILVLSKKLNDASAVVASFWTGLFGTVSSVVIMAIFEDLTMPRVLILNILLIPMVI